MSGVISSTTQAAREVVVDADNGYPWQASIGAAVGLVAEAKKLEVAMDEAWAKLPPDYQWLKDFEYV